MKKNLKAFLCSAVLLGTMFTGVAGAFDEPWDPAQDTITGPKDFEKLDIPEGSSLTIESGTVTVNDAMSENKGTLINNGTLGLSDIYVNSGSLTNNLNILNNGNGALLNTGDGNFTNVGLIGEETNRMLKVENNGQTFNNSGNINTNEFINNSGKTFTNSGTIDTLSFTNEGSISDVNGIIYATNGTNTGSIIQKEINLQTGGVFSNGTDDVAGTISVTNFINAGDFNNQNANSSITATYFENTGSFTNNGMLELNGLAKNEGVFTNNSTISSNNAIITNDASTSQFINTSTGTIGTADSRVLSISHSGDSFTNDGTIYTTQLINDASKTITNNGKIDTTGLINKTDGIIQGGNKSELIVGEGINYGTINQNSVTVNTYLVNGNIYPDDPSLGGSEVGHLTANTLTNNGQLGNLDTSEMTIGTLDNNAQLGNRGKIDVETLNNKTEDSSIANLYDTISISKELNNSGIINNNATIEFGTGTVLNNSGTIVNDGSEASLKGDVTVKNISTGMYGLQHKASSVVKSLENDGNVVLIDNSKLKITGQDGDINGKFYVHDGKNTLDASGTGEIKSQINIGNWDSNATLVMTNEDGTNNSLSIAKEAQLRIAPKGRLELANSGAVVNVDSNDYWLGDIDLQDATLNLDGISITAGAISTQDGGELPYYQQEGGTLNLINSNFKAVNSAAISGGNMGIDANSNFIALKDNSINLANLNSSGTFNVMNSGRGAYYIDNINIGANNYGEVRNQADFAIDVYARSNNPGTHSTDQFIGTNVTGDGTLYISDWNLNGDIEGWDAPIDRNIRFDNIFKYDNADETVKLNITKKEVLTPIGWYQLNNSGGVNGIYSLNLTKFNPMVFRGQVATVAQWQNQLAIEDMLFTHSMILPSFKEEYGGMANSGVMANRYASSEAAFAPYQYSRKDGGLWFKMYGNFERLQMNQPGISRVGNNSYGALIGADFGLKNLNNGWKYMPTAYISYNGSHQTYPGVGAYQNGGQIGYLGTWYKDNLILGALAYGGAYGNSMDVVGRDDDTFNYYAGIATKASYNWRIATDWVLQPNLFFAYNHFGQQNWHTTYGQMGMMAGALNGINLAPGLNLIWEKETFSTYLTLQYMYNLNGSSDGRAGNVTLPHVDMDRGFIQYGIGVNKYFTDRFSGYTQAVLRNIGRNGCGFQMGFIYYI